MKMANHLARRAIGLTSLCGAAWASASANAAPVQVYLPSAAIGASYACMNQDAAAPRANATITGFDKSVAILGGKPSALDLISAQQSGSANSETSAFTGSDEPPVQSLKPVCAINPRSQAIFASWFRPAPAQSGEFLGSRRIKIGSTPLDGAWRRVSRSSVAVSPSDLLGQAFEAPRLDQIRKVNAWVNRKIRFVEDRQLYGRADYWATAGETLKSRKGDCEDIAILKYHLLLNAGFDPAKMYLTIAKDTIRRRDHALLVVEEGGSFYLLDNETSNLLPGDQAHDYAARFSYSAQSSWIHGYTRHTEAPAGLDRRHFSYFSDSAVSSARVTGLSK